MASPRVWTNGTSWYDPRARLQQLSQLAERFPGRAAGGTGITGLTSNDSAGWSQMQADQREQAALGRLSSDQLNSNDDFSLDRMMLPTYGSADAPSTRTLAPATGRTYRPGPNTSALQSGADSMQAIAKAAGSDPGMLAAYRKRFGTR